MKAFARAATLALVLLLALAGAKAQQLEYTFEGNVTNPDPNGNLNFRTTVLVMDTNNKYAGFRSLRVSVTPGNADIDTLGGFVSWAKVPFALLAYWDIDASWTASTFSVEAAQNVIAQALLHLQERDANGTVVSTFGFGGGSEGPRTWSSDAKTTGDLKYFNIWTDIHNSDTDSTFRVTVTFFISSVSGVVDYGSTTVTPRKVESILRISNYTYSDPSNHLTLRLAAAVGDSELTINGGMVTSGAEGLSQLYVSVATECHVVTNENSLSGSVQAVTVSSFVVGDSDVRDQLVNSAAYVYLTSKFQSNWNVKIVTIDFPAGASHIVYDPTIGASETGSNTPTGAGSLVLPSLSFLLLALLAMLF